MPERGSVDERDRVEAWREQQLLLGRFPPKQALELAKNLTVDVHQAVALRAVCPLRLAMRILR